MSEAEYLHVKVRCCCGSQIRPDAGFHRDVRPSWVVRLNHKIALGIGCIPQYLVVPTAAASVVFLREWPDERWLCIARSSCIGLHPCNDSFSARRGGREDEERREHGHLDGGTCLEPRRPVPRTVGALKIHRRLPSSSNITLDATAQFDHLSTTGDEAARPTPPTSDRQSAP